MTCKQCGETKALEDFYKNDRKCKLCRSKLHVAYYYKNAERIRERVRKYDQTEEAILKRRVKGLRMKSKHPERFYARQLVRVAILKGEMTRPSECESCYKQTRPEAHHDDYAKPLEVRWLCLGCHRRLHPNARKLTRTQ